MRGRVELGRVRDINDHNIPTRVIAVHQLSRDVQGHPFVSCTINFLKFMPREHELSVDVEVPDFSERLLTPGIVTLSTQRRDVAVDILRGLVMVLMLLVDVCGDSVPFFAHAKWEGLNLADFVMPGFLLMVGASMRLSKVNRSQSLTRGHAFKRGLSRAVRMFALGVIVQGSWLPSIDGKKDTLGFNLDNVRVMGILQRISICYIAVLATTLFMKSRRSQLSIAFLLLATQTLILFEICVPGCLSCSDFSISCNSESYIDRIVLGNNHLYRPVEGYDPEGLVASLGATFTCFVGYMMTDIRMTRSYPRVWASAVMILVGIFLNFLGLPFNKSLWTCSYNFVTVGAILLVWYAIEKLFREDTGENVLVHLGSNAIFFYVFSDCGGLLRVLLNSVWIERDGQRVTMVSWFLNSVLKVQDYPNMIIVYALIQLALFVLITSSLYRRGIFIKL